MVPPYSGDIARLVYIVIEVCVFVHVGSPLQKSPLHFEVCMSVCGWVFVIRVPPPL